MTEIRNKDRILEAIDQLRHRKARPDINRICNFLLRRFSVGVKETEADLQKCVERQIVLKVEYKGSISYRNAAKKFSHVKRDGQGEKVRQYMKPKVTSPNRKFTDLLTNAIAELIVQEPDYLELGVPESELIKNILSKDSVKYSQKYVGVLLLQQVESGALIRMENGHYLVGPSKSEKSDDSDNVSTTSSKDKRYVIQIKPRRRPGPKPGWKKDTIGGENCPDSNDYDEKRGDNENLRVGGRRKKAKKVFDPSDNNIPKKRGRPVGSLNKSTIERQLARYSDNDSRPDSRSSNSGRDQGGVCSVCHIQSKKGPERMVACRECSNKAHYSCLNGEDMMLRMYPDNTWQCPHCKTCVVCYETSDAGYLTVCSICADGYHAGCHQPRLTEKIKPGQKWLCINCQMPDELTANEIQSNIGNRMKLSSTHDSHSDGSSLSGRSSPENYASPAPSPTPPTLSPQMQMHGGHSPERSNQSDSQSFKELDLEENIDPSIPDASNWTYDDVYNYFAQYFPEEAKVFKEQEIDGHSLLLMKRMDVLTSLKLKLGPALKIYRHVLKLQVRRDDPKLYWL